VRPDLAPSKGKVLELGFLGSVLQVAVPSSGNEQQLSGEGMFGNGPGEKWDWGSQVGFYFISLHFSFFPLRGPD
jgi:hypothetical protein